MIKMRRGFSSTEVVCAAIIVGVIGLTVGPALMFVRHQNRTASQHLAALQAANNLLDEVSSQPFSEVTPESVSAATLPDWLADQLPDAKLQMTVEENSEGKRIEAELAWTSVQGGPREREVVQVWIFEAGDPS